MNDANETYASIPRATYASWQHVVVGWPRDRKVRKSAALCNIANYSLSRSGYKVCESRPPFKEAGALLAVNDTVYVAPTFDECYQKALEETGVSLAASLGKRPRDL